MSVTTNVAGQLQNLRGNQDAIVARLVKAEAAAAQAQETANHSIEQISQLIGIVERLQIQLDNVHSDLDALSA